MSPSAGANRAAGRMLLQRPSRALPIPSRIGQPPPVDHRRPRKTETGNIVRRSVERFFARLGRNRRLAKDVEATIASATAFPYAASVLLLIRR